MKLFAPLALGCAGAIACASCFNQNSPDFVRTGTIEDSSSLVMLWSVTDTDTDKELASGCSNAYFGEPTRYDPGPRVRAVPGQHLLVELPRKLARYSEGDMEVNQGAAFWCSGDPRIDIPSNVYVSSVPSLDCWLMDLAPESTSAGRVTMMEYIPTPLQTDELPDDYAPGQGYRFWVEVLGTGPVFLSLNRSGTCDRFTGPLYIVTIEEA